MLAPGSGPIWVPLPGHPKGRDSDRDIEKAGHTKGRIPIELIEKTGPHEGQDPDRVHREGRHTKGGIPIEIIEKAGHTKGGIPIEIIEKAGHRKGGLPIELIEKAMMGSLAASCRHNSETGRSPEEASPAGSRRPPITEVAPRRLGLDGRVRGSRRRHGGRRRPDRVFSKKPEPAFRRRTMRGTCSTHSSLWPRLL